MEAYTFEPMKKLRIVFFGTPDFAVASLKALVDNEQNVVAVVTAPDKPAGRGHKLKASPVKEYALGESIPVLQPTNMKAQEFVDELKSFEADLQIVVAFRMMPEVVWNMPPLGTYNVHASLLPDYRGAAPINWAVINGEKETGVTTFKLKHEIDTGNILLQKRTAIDPNETAGELHDRLMALGAEAIVESVHLIAEGKAELKPQAEPEESKHAPKIFKDDCQIKWKQSAQQVHDFVRGMSPFPGAYFDIDVAGTTERWKVLRSELSDEQSKSVGTIKLSSNEFLIGCDDKYLALKEVQAPGKKRLPIEDFIRGLRVEADQLKVIA